MIEHKISNVHGWDRMGTLDPSYFCTKRAHIIKLYLLFVEITPIFISLFILNISLQNTKRIKEGISTLSVQWKNYLFIWGLKLFIDMVE